MFLITIGRKKSGYFEVFANDKSLGFFSENSIKNLKIINNKEYNLDYVKKIKLIGQIKYLQKKAMLLLKIKDYSEFELSRKLEKYSSKKIVTFVISQMKQKGFINDLRYAQNLAYKLILKKKKSKKLAILELLKKGVSKKIAEKAVSEVNCNTQQVVEDLILKKYN